MVYSCRDAKTRDLEQIVNCHMASFPGHFMTEMGSTWLAGLYGYFISHPQGLKVVVEDEYGSVCGFAFGGDRAIRSEFLNKAVLRYFYIILVKFFTKKMVRTKMTAEFFSRIRHLGRKNRKNYLNSKCGNLLSICVYPSYRGIGISGKLIESFKIKAADSGYEKITLTVESDNFRAIRFYEKNGWRTITKSYDSRSMELCLMSS